MWWWRCWEAVEVAGRAPADTSKPGHIGGPGGGGGGGGGLWEESVGMRRI